MFGGAWERITDKTLVGAGDKYSVNDTGGSNLVTLSPSNIPSLITKGSTGATNVTTSGDGSYNGTVTSSGTYQGGTYNTSTDGEHYHNLQDVGVYWGYPYGNGGMALQWNNIADGAIERTADAGAHSHSFSIPSQTITSYGNISIGNHTHSLTVPALSVTGKYANNSVQSFSTQDPYIAVYMWKRIS